PSSRRSVGRPNGDMRWGTERQDGCSGKGLRLLRPPAASPRTGPGDWIGKTWRRAYERGNNDRRSDMSLRRRRTSCSDLPQDVFAALWSGPRGRRTVLKAALGLGLCFLDVLPARAEDPSMTRPQEGDQFVFPLGDREGQIITPEDLPLGGPQQLAYPMAPRAKIVRNGSSLNQVRLIRLNPVQLTDDARALAAAGV